MESNNFKLALTDLYNIYNPSKVKDIERIVSTYNGREYDALKTIILRYNFKGHPSYSENANRDEYVNYIIKNYSEGNRILSKDNLRIQSEQEELEKIEEAKKEIELKEKEKESILNLGEETKSRIKEEVEFLAKNLENLIKNKTEEIDNYFNAKRKEFEEKEKQIKKVQEELYNYTGQTIVNEIVVENNKHTKVNIENLNFTDSDIKLPSRDILESLSKGTKLIVQTSEGRVCGIEVTDVTYDIISYEGEIVKEIILQKI
jgi:hypothetical protein